jgi:hypothetical protein
MSTVSSTTWVNAPVADRPKSVSAVPTLVLLMRVKYRRVDVPLARKFAVTVALPVPWILAAELWLLLQMGVQVVLATAHPPSTVIPALSATVSTYALRLCATYTIVLAPPLFAARSTAYWIVPQGAEREPHDDTLVPPCTTTNPAVSSTVRVGHDAASTGLASIPVSAVTLTSP